MSLFFLIFPIQEEVTQVYFNIERIRNQVNIVNFINRDEQLKKESIDDWRGGHSVKHSSKSNNCLSVSETKQVFYCFHCGASGDIFSYVMDRDSCGFLDAVKTVCDTCNIPYQELTSEQKAEYEKKRKEEKEVRALKKECFKFYHQQMTEQQRDYYHSRGLTDKTIDHEWLGYAPCGNVLVEYIVKKFGSQITEALKKTGLVFAERGRLIDRYQDRYVIPYWYRDEIVFSIGRTVDPKIESTKKYVKQLTHDKYHYVSDVAIRHIIWGEDLIRGAKRIIVAEGVFDALLAKQLGYKVISPFTNRFSRKDNERIAELCRAADAVYLIFDSEASGAGSEGAVKTAKELEKAGVNVKIATIPRTPDLEKIDLADYIVQKGDKAKEAVDELLSRSVDLFTFLLYQLDPEIDKSEIYDKLDAIIKQAVEADTEASKIKDWLEHTVREYFNLTVREISNYRAIVKKHVKKQEEKQNQEQEEKSLTTDNLDWALPLWQIIELAHWRINSEGEQYRISVIKPEWQLAEIVFNWFEANDAKLFKDNHNTPFIFHKKLYEIGDNPRFSAFFQEIAHINNTTPEGRYLFKALQNIAISRGKKTESNSWLHLDRNTNSIYINQNDSSSKLLKISPHKIESVENATNDNNILLYSSTKFKPIEFISDVKEEDGINLFKEKLLDNLACSESDRLLVGSWIAALFVKSYTQTRALMKFSGGHQTGKTVGAKLLASLIYGEPAVKVSTVAANFSDAAKNPLVILDDLETENLSDPYLQFLRLAATGATKEKRDVNTTSENVLEKVDALVLITAIDPLAQQTLISRSYDINFSRRYQNPDFLEDDVIYEIINHRNLILSSIFKALAHQILPRFVSGDQREIVKMLRLNYPDHAKRRTNSFLASLYMIYEGLNHYCPLSDASPKEVLDKWILVQQEEASVASAETTPVLLYLNSLWDYFAKSNELALEMEGDQIDETPPIIKQYGHLIMPELNSAGKFVSFITSANGLHNAFAKYCRQHGLKYKFSNPRQVMKHINDAEELLSAHGWEIEKNLKTLRGERFHKFTRADDIVPF